MEIYVLMSGEIYEKLPLYLPWNETALRGANAITDADMVHISLS